MLPAAWTSLLTRSRLMGKHPESESQLLTVSRGLGMMTSFLPQGLCPSHAVPLPRWRALLPAPPRHPLSCLWGLGSVETTATTHPSAHLSRTLFHILHVAYPAPTPPGRVFVTLPPAHPTSPAEQPSTLSQGLGTCRGAVGGQGGDPGLVCTKSLKQHP